MVFFVLVAGVIGTTFQAVIATRQRDRAIAAEEQQSRERQRAEQARQEAEEARDNLQAVVDFRSSMLSEIDPEEMGRALFADLRARVGESLEAEGVSPEEIDSALAGFDQTLRRANATDAALKLAAEQVLIPVPVCSCRLGRDRFGVQLVRGAARTEVRGS